VRWLSRSAANPPVDKAGAPAIAAERRVTSFCPYIAKKD